MSESGKVNPTVFHAFAGTVLNRSTTLTASCARRGVNAHYGVVKHFITGSAAVDALQSIMPGVAWRREFQTYRA